MPSWSSALRKAPSGWSEDLFDIVLPVTWQKTKHVAKVHDLINHVRLSDGDICLPSESLHWSLLSAISWGLNMPETFEELNPNNRSQLPPVDAQFLAILADDREDKNNVISDF